MKILKFISAAVLAVLLGTASFAQMHDHSKMTSLKTEHIKVFGNCNSCKARIESAANLPGVSKAQWNSATKILTVVYDPAKVKSDDIQKKIASVGHDTQKYKANNKTYSSLPACCQYERRK
ncbi:MAG: cation transporter [Bacteroidota bacterium]|nr:cation transporter [Bacteroidota bacterium]MDP4227964.1 cation transporter [Bacteroidota bacterium]